MDWYMDMAKLIQVSYAIIVSVIERIYITLSYSSEFRIGIPSYNYFGSSPVDGIYLPNILALWRRKTCIEKNPEFETRKPEKLSSTFHWIYPH